MERKSLTLSIVPSTMSKLPGEFMFYTTIVDWNGREADKARVIISKHVNFPSADDRAEVNWAIEICDAMYQELTAWYANVKRQSAQEVNARPGDTSVSS